MQYHLRRRHLRSPPIGFRNLHDYSTPHSTHHRRIADLALRCADAQCRVRRCSETILEQLLTEMRFQVSEWRYVACSYDPRMPLTQRYCHGIEFQSACCDTLRNRSSAEGRRNSVEERACLLIDPSALLTEMSATLVVSTWTPELAITQVQAQDRCP